MAVFAKTCRPTGMTPWLVDVLLMLSSNYKCNLIAIQCYNLTHHFN
jgi:hypothetical protein